MLGDSLDMFLSAGNASRPRGGWGRGAGYGGWEALSTVVGKGQVGVEFRYAGQGTGV